MHAGSVKKFQPVTCFGLPWKPSGTPLAQVRAASFPVLPPAPRRVAGLPDTPRRTQAHCVPEKRRAAIDGSILIGTGRRQFRRQISRVALAGDGCGPGLSCGRDRQPAGKARAPVHAQLGGLRIGIDVDKCFLARKLEGQDLSSHGFSAAPRTRCLTGPANTRRPLADVARRTISWRQSAYASAPVRPVSRPSEYSALSLNFNRCMHHRDRAVDFQIELIPGFFLCAQELVSHVHWVISS